MASLGRILYAEDNAVIRTTNVKLLERIGFEVDTVVNGQEAVKKFQREEEKVEYLFILMDCKMPALLTKDILPN